MATIAAEGCQLHVQRFGATIQLDHHELPVAAAHELVGLLDEALAPDCHTGLLCGTALRCT
jgi:hypothetical protein